MVGPGCQGEEAELCPIGPHVLLCVTLFWFVSLKVIIIVLMTVISRIENINCKKK